MLKHCVIYHPDLDHKTVEFKMRILSSHSSAFERQIREAVLINKYSGVRSMNSKLEYNRCSIPTMMMKTGNKDGKTDTTLEQEKTANEKIKTLYGERNKKRNIDGANRNTNRKRRKMDSDNNLIGEINLHDDNGEKDLIGENSRLESTLEEKTKGTPALEKHDHIPPATAQLNLEIRYQLGDHDRQLDEVGMKHLVKPRHELETGSQLCDLGCQLDHCHRYFPHEIVPKETLNNINLFDKVIRKFDNNCSRFETLRENASLKSPAEVSQAMLPNDPIKNRDQDICPKLKDLGKIEDIAVPTKVIQAMMREDSPETDALAIKPKLKALGKSESGTDPQIVNQSNLKPDSQNTEDHIIDSKFKALGKLKSDAVPLTATQSLNLSGFARVVGNCELVSHL